MGSFRSGPRLPSPGFRSLGRRRTSRIPVHALTAAADRTPDAAATMAVGRGSGPPPPPQPAAPGASAPRPDAREQRPTGRAAAAVDGGWRGGNRRCGGYDNGGGRHCYEADYHGRNWDYDGYGAYGDERYRGSLSSRRGRGHGGDQRQFGGDQGFERAVGGFVEGASGPQQLVTGEAGLGLTMLVMEAAGVVVVLPAVTLCAAILPRRRMWLR